MKLDVMDCAGRLMSRPSDDSTDVVIDRAQSLYLDHSERFRHTNKDFSRQYFHCYAQRLSLMKDMLLPRINQKWGKSYSVFLSVLRLC